jgi:hypothetical protein
MNGLFYLQAAFRAEKLSFYRAHQIDYARNDKKAKQYNRQQWRLAAAFDAFAVITAVIIRAYNFQVRIS